MRHEHCPACGSLDSEVVHTEFHTDVVERVSVCSECQAQWTVAFTDPTVRDVVEDPA